MTEREKMVKKKNPQLRGYFFHISIPGTRQGTGNIEHIPGNQRTSHPRNIVHYFQGTKGRATLEI